MMARMAVFRAETDENPDTLRWVDRMLIRMVSEKLVRHKAQILIIPSRLTVSKVWRVCQRRPK
jgi:hypothetical protein